MERLGSHQIYNGELSPNYEPYAAFTDLATNPIKTALSYNADMLASIHEHALFEIRNIDSSSLAMSISCSESMFLSDTAWRPFFNDVVISSYDSKVRIWDIQAKTISHMCMTNALVDNVTVHPAGNLIAMAAHENVIQIWDARANIMTHSFQSPSRFLSCINFSPSGEELVISTSRGKIVIWNLRIGEPSIKFSVGEESRPVSYAMFTREKRIVTSEAYYLKMWSTERSQTGSLLNEFTGHESFHHNHASNFCIDADKFLIMGSEDGKVFVWDLATEKILQVFQAHNDVALRAVAVPMNNIIATSSIDNDKSIKIWKRSNF